MNAKTLLVVALATGLATSLPSPVRAQGMTSGGYSTYFQLLGQVMRPKTYSLASLAVLPVTRQNVVFYAGLGQVSASYTGVLLWDLLGAAGLITNPTIKNDLLRQRVVVTGSDGYQAVFSLGELAPQFGGEQVMMAYAANGALLDQSTGFAEIIVPGDKAGGRAVNTVVRIEVLEGS